MATFSEHLCEDCGLRATISPGDSANSAGATRTGYCVHCEDFHAPVLEEGTCLLPRSLDVYQRRRFVCETHFSTPLAAWFKGMRCPRCGGSFARDPNGVSFCAD